MLPDANPKALHSSTVKVTIPFINIGRNIRGIKVSPMRAGREISETFLLVKISGYNLVSGLWTADTHS